MPACPRPFITFCRRWSSVNHGRFPKIRVKVHDASANEVLVAVAQGNADFGLNFIGSQEAEIEFKPVLAERFVAACRRDLCWPGARR